MTGLSYIQAEKKVLERYDFWICWDKLVVFSKVSCWQIWQIPIYFLHLFYFRSQIWSQFWYLNWEDLWSLHFTERYCIHCLHLVYIRSEWKFFSKTKTVSIKGCIFIKTIQTERYISCLTDFMLLHCFVIFWMGYDICFKVKCTLRFTVYTVLSLCMSWEDALGLVIC